MADQRNASGGTRSPAEERSVTNGSVTQSDPAKPRSERVSGADSSSTIDVDALARRLEQLLPEIGRVRVIRSCGAWRTGDPPATRDLLDLESHQAKRVVDLLELLRELRAGAR